MTGKSRQTGCKFMDSRDIVVLRKILQRIASVLRYCENCHSMEEFEADSMRVEATVFNLVQIGELAKVSLSDTAKAQLNNIPWHQLYGMRNRIVHGYDSVNMRIVWDTVQSGIPELNEEIQEALNRKSTD